MKDNDDDIQFETMPDWGGITLGSNNKSKEKLKPITQSHPEKEYTSLYEELEDKCNPRNFMEPFVLERFNMANEIYSQLRSSEDKSDDALIYLRNRCIKELNISFSTKRIYDRLFSIVNPEVYLKEEVYDAEKVRKSGELYDKLIKKQHDIRALEELEIEVLEFVNEYEKHDETSKLPESESGEVNDNANWYEDYFFLNSNAREYLDKYPHGNHADEARYYLQNDKEDYEKMYPQGRYVFKTTNVEEDDDSTTTFIVIGAVVILVAIVIITHVL